MINFEEGGADAPVAGGVVVGATTGLVGVAVGVGVGMRGSFWRFLMAK